MTTDPKPTAAASDVVVGPRDILFECPSCNKSLVVDEIAEGQVVPCPQCGTSVIVPPKTPAPPSAPPAPPPPATAPAPAAPATPQIPATQQAAAAAPATVAELKQRLTALQHKLAELHMQRTEVTNRITSRLNEINRDLVLLTRHGTAQQQLNSEYEQLARDVEAALQKAASPPPASGGTRVNFRA